MCCKKLALVTMVLFVISASLFAEFSKNDARDLVLNQIVGDEIENVNIYQEADIYSSNLYELNPYKSLNVPYSNCWLFFIDDNPLANWEHECRYVFVNSENGIYNVVNEKVPLIDYETTLEEVSINVVIETGNYQYDNPQPIETREPDPHKYAILLSGETNVRHWNDMSAMYCALKEVYGYTDENMIVLSHSGEINPYHNVSLDLDPHQDDIDDIDGACTYENVENAFQWMEDELDSDDILFVYVNDHGGTHDHIDDSYICLYQWAPLEDEEFAAMVAPINCSEIIHVMEQCYAGGFQGELEGEHVTFHAATDGAHSSYGGTGVAAGFDEFVYYWTTATRGYHPLSNQQPWITGHPIGEHELLPYDFNPDEIIHGGNGDGFIQMQEAFEYADYMDLYSPYGECQSPIEFPQEYNNIGFQEDLLSLSGLCGYVENTQTISGNFMINPALTINPGISLTLSENTTIISHGILSIEDGVSFYCGEGSKIKIEEGGSFIAIGSILFTSSGEEPWLGIELWEAEESHFRYCQIENAETGVLLWHANNGTFRDNEINNCNIGLFAKGDVSTTRVIELNDFNNNKTGIFLYHIGSQLPDTQFYVDHNTIVGDEGVGIYLNNCGSELKIGDNTITNNKYGISVEYSDSCELLGSDSDDYSIEENNVGVSFYQSTVDMKDLTITDNADYGVMFLSDSHPTILSNRIINNGDYELYCNYGHPVMADGHNDIVHTSAGYLGYRYRDNVRFINCRYNWWGSYPPDPEKFHPYGDSYFRYNPADESSNHPFAGGGIGEDSDARIAYKNAMETEGNEDYSSAAVLYSNIIDTYPLSEEALLSLRRLFICEKNAYGNMYDLKIFYEELANSCPEDTVFCLLSRNLAIDCDKENELYEDALLQYSDILDLPIDEADSIFTQINIMSTLLEIEGFGRNTVCLENLPENIRRLNPADVKDFQIKSQNLLDNLLGEPEEEPSGTLPACATLHRNYPNPFNPTTTISFSISNESNVELSIFNIKGQKVKSLVKYTFASGNHSVVWNGNDDTGKSVSSGVYFYKLNVSGVSKQIRKCILMK